MTLELKESCLLHAPDKRSTLVLKDKGKAEYRLKNPLKCTLSAYKLDGCCTQTRACDFLILEHGEPRNEQQSAEGGCLLELKGSDLREAIQQISAVLPDVKNLLPHVPVHARVVLNRVRAPDVRPSELTHLRKKLTSFQYASQQLEETLPWQE